MTNQDLGHTGVAGESSATTDAKNHPEAPTAHEAGDSTQAARNQNGTSGMEQEKDKVDGKNVPGRWQKVRENIKDLVLPFAALAVTAIGGFYTREFNQRDRAAKNAESRSKIVAELTSNLPLQRELAAITLSEQGEEAFPTLHVILGTDDVKVQETACEVLRAIAIAKSEDRDMRGKVLNLVRSDIENGDYVLFRGGAQCASLKDFATDEEEKVLLQAIERRLGPEAGFCSPPTADQDGIVRAIQAESNFPMAANAPAFLISVIQNCPDTDIGGAKETAIDSLCEVFKKVYPRNWSIELKHRLAPLSSSAYVLSKIGDPPCQ